MRADAEEEPEPLEGGAEEGRSVGDDLEGLAPGRYLAMALEHAEELPYREPDLIQRYLSEGKEVTLTPNGKSEVQLDVVAGEPYLLRSRNQPGNLSRRVLLQTMTCTRFRLSASRNARGIAAVVATIVRARR